MNRKGHYLKNIYFPAIVRLLMAFINFQMSFAMFDLVTAATAGNWDLFWDHSIVALAYTLAMFPTSILLAYTRGRFIKGALEAMKSDYLKSVFNKNISEFQRDNNALYLSAITNDFDLIERDYLEPILTCVFSVIGFGTAILIIAIISPLFVVIALGIAVINFVVTLFSDRPVKRHNAERSDMMRDYSGFVKEALSAYQIIKANDLESRIQENFAAKSKRVQQKKYVIDKIFSFIFAFQNINAYLTVFALLLLVAYQTIMGALTFAGVIVIFQNIDFFIGPIIEFSETIPRIKSVKVLFTRIDESLKNKSVYPETADFDTLKHTIEFDKVSFAYDENVVLNQISLEFQKGGKYLIVGPSGGGKSTILRLLRKYFAPTEGDIKVDGISLKDIKKVDYFSKIANIEQQVFLFEDTLKNNLTLYKEHSDQEIADAIRRAGLEDFVSQHADGLGRKIVDNGKNISGGEKSRIAIARGLLNKAEIIFLDEAFASLDLDKARAIERSVLALENVTVINVSHVIIKENLDQYDEVITVKNQKVWIRELASASAAN
ncbi:MAG: ABC transporter ATP-binding protein [Candidatus Izemoplasmatales bacterium]|nr:ABC transporter ATP-binding protein [Candidatus Izemoplasmatales bacterium]